MEVESALGYPQVCQYSKANAYEYAGVYAIN